MTRKAGNTQPKKTERGAIPHDVIRPASPVYNKYADKAAAHSETVDTYYGHRNAKGEVWLLSGSSAPIRCADDLQRVRDETIAYNLSCTHVEITGAHPNQVRRAWKATPEDAERCCAIKQADVDRWRAQEVEVQRKPAA